MFIKTDALGNHELIDDDDIASWWSKVKSVAKSAATMPFTAPFKAAKYSLTIPYRGAKAYFTGPVKRPSDFLRFR
jgi:hypothetical protein